MNVRSRILYDLTYGELRHPLSLLHPMSQPEPSPLEEMKVQKIQTKILLITRSLFAALALAACEVIDTAGAESGDQVTEKPQFTADGKLVRPENYFEWIFVGSPLTPNGLNGGEAAFPEFHNVYIQPSAYRIYKKTGVFPEGTIL